jgi:4-hydroxybenzoate-CoA ligase
MSESSTYNACEALLDRNVAEGRGGKTVFTDPQRSITYGALVDETKRCANLLRGLGLRREDRVLMIMLDTIDWPIVFLGAIRAGVIPIPVNTLMPVESYRYMLADSGARALFVSAALLPAVEPVLADLPDLERIVVVGTGAKAEAGTVATVDFTTALAAEPAQFTTAKTHADETAFWLYSSGSTGAPKGTRHIHTSLMATAQLYGQGVLGIRESDVCLSAAKLFFAYGLGNALTFPMSAGASVILSPDRPTPALMFKLLAQEQPTLFFGVPTLYAAMLADAALADERGSASLRACVSAGEALPEHVGLAWQRRLGCPILDGVGSTEMLHIFLSNAPGDIVYGTSGRAVPGYDLRLLNDNGAEACGDEVGELYVRGPSSADGYWKQREKSRATFQGEWTRTGDKYTRDASQRYTYCGRSDDMFKVSGIWVSPFEIETALGSHEAVLEAAVVAAADDEGLLKPKAFVVLKQNATREGLEERLKEHVKKTAGAWKYPRWIEIVDGLPKTATGKIQRFKLRQGG